MKTFKKILFIILALLPIISLVSQLVITACAVNHTDATEYLEAMPFLTSTFSQTREVYVLDDDVRYLMIVLPSAELGGGTYTTLESTMLSQFCSHVIDGNERYYVTQNPFVGGIGAFLSEAGLAPNVCVLYVIYLLWYWFLIMLVYALWELITFVPRKCSEIFQ